jgi:hypothetical protein
LRTNNSDLKTEEELSCKCMKSQSRFSALILLNPCPVANQGLTVIYLALNQTLPYVFAKFPDQLPKVDLNVLFYRTTLKNHQNIKFAFRL